MTPEEANIKIQERIDAIPEIKALVSDPAFDRDIAQIIDFANLNEEYFTAIRFEILLVMAQYVPSSELEQNIIEATRISPEAAELITGMITSIILSPISDELDAFGAVWKEQLEKEQALPKAPTDVREELELRPEGVIPAAQTPAVNTSNAFTPLSREDVMKALSTKRTMEGDIESLKHPEGE